MWKRLQALLFGAPKDIRSEKTFHSISLIAMLAWVGLGADGLSSSAYGPEAAFRELVADGHDYSSLAVGLAVGTALTVFIISYAYSRIIEHFPSGGGGYVVATKLLGARFGVVSGSALLVDYVLTITTSIASGGDAIFSMIPRSWFGPAAFAVSAEEIGTWLDPVQRTKIIIEIGAAGVLIVLNIRGVKESVQAIVPVFVVFVVTHVILLAVAIFGNVGAMGGVAHETSINFRHTVRALGSLGAVMLFVRAYSLGGGTYTGIEAVSNGVQIMREPKVRTAKRTMGLMATSLALTAGGIILAYLLVHAKPVDDKTMNAVLLDRVCGGWHIGGWHLGWWFVTVALASEAGLLLVAAQAGFVDGPRVMANMAIDSWMPHRFAALSERLSMQNGVVLMGVTSVLALLYTHGNVEKLVVMYSINVFLTFSLSNLGMARFWIKHRREHAELVDAPADSSPRTRTMSNHSHRDCVREVRGRRMADARRHGASRRSLSVDQAALQQGGRGHPPLGRRARRSSYGPACEQAERDAGVRDDGSRVAHRLEAAGRRPFRGTVWRPWTTRASHDAPNVPRSLQGDRVLLGRSCGLGELQGPGGGPRARGTRAARA